MKKSIFLVFLLISGNTIAQPKTDLYLRVDSIIKYELKFYPQRAMAIFDSVVANTSQTVTKTAFRGDTGLLAPMILVNGIVVHIDYLNIATIADVKKIMVLKSPEVASLYGYRGIYGVIAITGKKKLTRKVIKNK